MRLHQAYSLPSPPTGVRVMSPQRQLWDTWPQAPPSPGGAAERYQVPDPGFPLVVVRAPSPFPWNSRPRVRRQTSLTVYAWSRGDGLHPVSCAGRSCENVVDTSDRCTVNRKHKVGCARKSPSPVPPSHEMTADTRRTGRQGKGMTLPWNLGLTVSAGSVAAAGRYRCRTPRPRSPRSPGRRWCPR